MRFKDLIGRKSEPEVSPGRLVTTPAAPVPRTAPSAPDAPGPRTAPDALDAPGPRPAPDAPDAPVPRTAPIAPAAPVAPGSMADLFTRLLAAEQGEPAPPPSSVPARLNEVDAERIAARVAERFEGALRDEVRRIVGEVAERLVREEIARIRRAAESEPS